MKKNMIWAGALSLCLMMMFPAHAQQGYSIVYDLYYNLMLNPESGDDSIYKNQGLFDSHFYNCLNLVQQRAQQAALQHTQMCNQYVNPQARAQCEQKNEAGKLWTWTRQVRSACRGEMRWSETTVGWATISSKNTMESLMPGQWNSIVNGVMPQMRPLLMCQ